MLTYALVPDGRASTDRPWPVAAPPETVIEAAIDVRRPRVDLRTRADRDGLPLMRQALRALGQAGGADPDSLHDAELALTEACANVVLHAYEDDEGTVEVTIEARAAELLASVRDRGRGMSPRPSPASRGGVGGLGLSLIEAVAHDVEIQTQRHGGTMVVMVLPALGPAAGNGDSPAGESPTESVVRRLTAMAAAQADLPHERITDALLAAELVAHYAPRYLIGNVLHARIERHDGGLQLSIGSLERDGGAAVLRDTGIPMLGPIVERLTQGVGAVPATAQGSDAGEELVLRFAA